MVCLFVLCEGQIPLGRSLCISYGLHALLTSYLDCNKNGREWSCNYTATLAPPPVGFTFNGVNSFSTGQLALWPLGLNSEPHCLSLGSFFTVSFVKPTWQQLLWGGIRDPREQGEEGRSGLIFITWKWIRLAQCKNVLKNRKLDKAFISRFSL